MHHHWRKYRKHIWTYIILASAVVAATIALLNYRSAQAGFIYPNIYIGDINFGGKTPDEAKNLLNKKVQAILENGVTVKIKGKDTKFGLYEYAADPDLSRDLLKFDVIGTVAELYAAGRETNLFSNLKNSILSMAGRVKMPSKVELLDEDLLSYLKEKLKSYEAPAKNAAISFAGDDIKILDDEAGVRADYARITQELKLQLEHLQAPYLDAELIPDIPAIKKYEVADRISDIKTALARAPFSIKYNDSVWTINREALKKYLDFEKKDGVAAVAISAEKTAPLFKKITETLDVPAQNARFEIKNGKVTEFQTSRLGITLDAEATRDALNSILQNGYPAINAIVQNSSPEITTSDANKLGIGTLLGVGTSTFVGSPPNRIHNIATGAGKINGLLLKPGEEFSTLKAIGSVDEKAGFKRELVIKEDRTTPEFGGGLCQIGTTLFRAALATGLPITERRAHSYRVAYYEPAGTDATIYSPSPDFKFLNDTPGFILVQAKVEGTAVVFEFWGTSDGREVARTNPVIYNIAKPPPPRYIETADLAPGEKKKIETAHNGADAYFKYTVKYPDSRGEISKTFSSHYRPWSEVWLLGATSTPVVSAQIKNAP